MTLQDLQHTLVIKLFIEKIDIANIFDEQATARILGRPDIFPLLQEERTYLYKIARHANGNKRLPLTERQKDLSLITRHLAEFDHIIGAWLETTGETPYAVEHVLAHYNPQTGNMQEKGPHAKILNDLDHHQIQRLRQYSAYQKRLEEIYLMTRKTSITYTTSATEVARLLIGRTLLTPREKLTPTEKTRWTKFLNGNNKNYRPIESRILETEAFETHEDVSRMRYCMLAPPGQIDIMKFRGHTYLNIGTGQTGLASCVMIRAAEIDGEIYEGPGRVGKTLNAEGLVGLVLEKDIPVIGQTAPSGRISGKGSKQSLGGYRIQ